MILDPAELTRPVDLSARVIYFPVRHHSPACAWHVDRLIRDIRPDAVLIEGPRNATPLLPLILSDKTRFPVAIYTTYVEREPDHPPRRHAAYYPFCDYSPELAALRAAAAVQARCRFIDLTFPEMVRAGRVDISAKASSLLDERRFAHSRFLRQACLRAGVRDPDDLWDHLFEVSHREAPTDVFVRSVLTYCAIARAEASNESLEADGTLPRERAMAAAIAEEAGRVVVVTGGFHSVALPGVAPAMPPPLKVANDDAVVVLTRYGFEQLDRLNGYASGMPSPEFYQRRWEERPPAGLFVDLGRLCRERGLEISVADEIAAADQCLRLARLRQHPLPSRQDVLDGVRSSFVKGAADAEGVMTLALARQLLAGERVGDVPPDAGQPPIVGDFRDTATRLKIELDRVRATDAALDLYRRAAHREISRLFHRLAFLGVPFAVLQAGPDFVNGKDLERVQELWKYHWSPEVESVLIERALYGPSLEEASAARLAEQFSENEKHGDGGRADLAALLILSACRMGLHRHAPDLLRRTTQLVGADQSFPSLVKAIESLLVLHVSREPMEAHRLQGILELASFAYERACFLIPSLATVAEGEETDVIGALVGLCQSVQTLGDDEVRRELRCTGLRELGVAAQQGNAAVRGAAAGLLYGDGQLDGAALAAAFRGALLGGGPDGESGADFLRGLLRTARSAIWQVPQIVADLHATLAQMPEEKFLHQLPLLRLAFADLTPRETDSVAELVANRAGVEKLQIARSVTFSAEDMRIARKIEFEVDKSLAADGLTAFAAAGAVP